ncbi:hypothetical protein EE612_056997 [Oryza sativa]|nr:hypothetical protein EE612_056997 [Oryza sativa]
MTHRQATPRRRGSRALHDLRLPNPPRLLARRPPTPADLHPASRGGAGVLLLPHWRRKKENY